VSELAALELESVDLDQEVVFVLGKGNRPRVVPFSATTGTAIDRYLRARRTHPYARRTDSCSPNADRSPRTGSGGDSRRSASRPAFPTFTLMRCGTRSRTGSSPLAGKNAT
jgi:integrase